MKIIWNKINTHPVFQQENGKYMIAIKNGENIITSDAETLVEEVIKEIREKLKNEIIA